MHSNSNAVGYVSEYDSTKPASIHSTHARDAEYYGNLARVAVNFHVQVGTPGELLAAYVYARYAARIAAYVLRVEGGAR
jgi:hypothetical protein